MWWVARVPTKAKCKDARIATISRCNRRWIVDPEPGFEVIDEDYDTIEHAIRSCVAQAIGTKGGDAQ